MSAQESLPGAPEFPTFGEFEASAVNKLRTYLDNPQSDPLLTIDERDILIESDPLYFGAINRRYTPRNALQKVREGTLTDADIEQKQRAARAIVRGKKTDMYTERMMTATYAVDTCRALYRVATKGELIPVDADDTVDTLRTRTGDYVTDLLRAGREQRVLHGAAMQRTVDKITTLFETDDEVMIKLTELAGMNSMKKVHLYLDSLHRVSRGYERMTGETKAKLLGYIASRPAEFFDKPDLNRLIANKVSS